ncbi:MAG: hypothetical protein J7M38_12165 [Armatimonadetes bacterium]|nr:hypothetical protein [Armatimonadota bacterium]
MMSNRPAATAIAASSGIASAEWKITIPQREEYASDTSVESRLLRRQRLDSYR